MVTKLKQNVSKPALTFLLSFCILVSFSQNTFARKKPALQNKAMQHYQLLLSENETSSLRNIKTLEAVLPRASVKDALNLQNALFDMKNRQNKKAYRTLNKIKTDSPLSLYALYHKARILKDEEKYAEALDFLPVLTTPQKKIERDLFWLRSELLALTGQIQLLGQEIETLKKTRRKDKIVTIKGSYYLGLAAFNNDNTEEAYSQFRNVVVYNPGTLFDNKIFQLLNINSVTPGKFMNTQNWNLRAEKLADSGFPQKALHIWESLYQKNKSFEEKVAYGHYRARHYEKAAQLYLKLLDSKNAKSSPDEIWDKIASSFSRYDSFKEAIKASEYILKNFPGTHAAGIAYFKLGFLYFDAEDYQKSIDYFEPFLTKGSRWQKERARWFRLWGYYLLKKYDLAFAEIENLLELYKKNPDKTEAFTYWKARLYDKMGKTTAAKILYQNLSASNPFSYYGLLARQRSHFDQLFKKTLIHPKLLSVIPRPLSDTAQNLPDNIPATDSLSTALLLSHMRQLNHAFDESQYSSLLNDLSHASVISAFETAGNYNRSFAARKMALAGKIPGLSSDHAFKIAYPGAYSFYAEPMAAIWNLPATLVYAVMRQESAFKPEALSYAAAYGLMQIIPPTGDEIAEKIGFDNFSVELLNQPEVNIFFGAFYLRELLNTFQDELVFALAAYNAGPEPVTRWSKKADKMELDEFVELIPYSQTNDYVKKVLVNFLIYSRLYSQQ